MEKGSPNWTLPQANHTFQPGSPLQTQAWAHQSPEKASWQDQPKVLPEDLLNGSEFAKLQAMGVIC